MLLVGNADGKDVTDSQQETLADVVYDAVVAAGWDGIILIAGPDDIDNFEFKELDPVVIDGRMHRQIQVGDQVYDVGFSANADNPAEAL